MNFAADKARLLALRVEVDNAVPDSQGQDGIQYWVAKAFSCGTRESLAVALIFPSLVYPS